MAKIHSILKGKSPSGGSVRSEIYAGGRKVRITQTKKGMESVVTLEAGHVGAIRQLLELAFYDVKVTK